MLTKKEKPGRSKRDIIGSFYNEELYPGEQDELVLYLQLNNIRKQRICRGVRVQKEGIILATSPKLMTAVLVGTILDFLLLRHRPSGNLSEECSIHLTQSCGHQGKKGNYSRTGWPRQKKAYSYTLKVSLPAVFPLWALDAAPSLLRMYALCHQQELKLCVL